MTISEIKFLPPTLGEMLKNYPERVKNRTGYARDGGGNLIAEGSINEVYRKAVDLSKSLIGPITVIEDNQGCGATH